MDQIINSTKQCLLYDLVIKIQLRIIKIIDFPIRLPLLFLCERVYLCLYVCICVCKGKNRGKTFEFSVWRHSLGGARIKCQSGKHTEQHKTRNSISPAVFSGGSYLLSHVLYTIRTRSGWDRYTVVLIIFNYIFLFSVFLMLWHFGYYWSWWRRDSSSQG